ncbi:MAG TPA: hypothetical protein VKG24_01455 [Pseudolabrys sp.]|nr:hypothetical protein [Pseudolabrys sp.]
MRASIVGDRHTSERSTQKRHHAESAVATIWLVFYVLALGVAFSSPFVYAAIELAAR